MSKLNFLSFFSGIGGFEVALMNSFGKKAKCVGFSEIAPNAIKVYQSHFPDHTALGDIATVTNQTIEKLYHEVGGIDLIVGGFPCQNLSNISSIKGDNRGLQGAQSGLFFDLIRIMSVIDKLNKARDKKTYFILENVRSTKTHRDLIHNHLSKMFTESITETELDSSHFSAQTRIRYIWTNWPVKPVPPDLKGPSLTSVLEPKAIVLKRIKEIQYSERMIKCLNKWLVVKTPNPSGLGHYQAVCKPENKSGVRYCNFVNTKPPQPDMRCRWPRYGFSDTIKEKSQTIVSHFPHVLIDRRFGDANFVVRGFFTSEMERLFTFPAGWMNIVLVGKKPGSPASDTHGVTKLLGNSVVVSAIQYITDQLLTKLS